MCSLLLVWIGALIRLFRSRGNLSIRNLVLRQQLAVLKRRHPRPSIRPLDKLFWVVVRRFLSGWKQALIVERRPRRACRARSEEHTSELQSHSDLVCRLLLEKKK